MKKKYYQRIRKYVKFFAIGCVFYRVGDWDNLQVDLHVSLHVGLYMEAHKIQFAGIIPVFLEFNGANLSRRKSDETVSTS